MFSFTESDSKSVAHLAVTLTDITVMNKSKMAATEKLFFRYRYIARCHKIRNKYFLLWFFKTSDFKLNNNSTVRLIVTPNY